MSAEVVRLVPEQIGDGYRFDANEVLEAAKDCAFATLMILGETEDGELYVAGTANAGETLILMEKAKRQIVFGDGE